VQNNKIKPKSQFFSIAGLFLMSWLSSCSSVYLPNVPATPMFRNQGEIHLSAHVNPKGNMSGNAGVAITDHIALIGGGSFVNYQSNNHDFRQHLYEGGLGYFANMGKSDRNVMEVYAGYGVGATRDVDKRATTTGTAPVETRSLDFNKIFLQANFSSTRENKLAILGKQRTLTYGTAVRVAALK